MRLVVALLCACLACGDDDAGLDAGLDAGPDAAADAGGAVDVGVGDASADAPPTDGGGDDASDAEVEPVDRFDAVLEELRREADAATLDALLTDVARAEGWPLVSGERWLFATRWDAAEVAWVGDPNAWDPTANPAETAPSGVHHFVELRFATAPRGQKYKWWSEGTFRAPLEATAYGEDSFGEFGWVAPPSESAWLERYPAFARAGVDPRMVRVRVPADFVWAPRAGARADRAVRTLVLHDGQNVFLSGGPFGGWQVDATLDRDYPDVLAVAIDNGADRFATYTPVADDIGSGPIGGDAATYLAFVEDDVLPFVRARYGVRATGPSLMIAGSSLGGLVSLEGAHTRPALAGCVAGLSSTLGWGAFDGDGSGTLVRRWSTHGTTAIYLDSGGGGVCGDSDGDGVHEDSDDRDNYCVTLQLRDHLVGLGYELGVDLFHWHEPGAPHSEAAWAARVGRFLDACVSGGWIAE